MFRSTLRLYGCSQFALNTLNNKGNACQSSRIFCIFPASLEVRQAGRRTLDRATGTNSGGGTMSQSDSVLTILHFNDVYNVQPQREEPEGGAARFVAAIKAHAHLDPLVLFSGDVFSPSMLSTFTKGEQMSCVLNNCNVACAVFGNHEFDFGLEVLSARTAETNFPWLMSNVIDNETGRPLGDGKITHVVDWVGKRLGLIGLVEREWLDTLATINPDEVTFLDFVDVGNKLGDKLKQEGCDYVIALTHMRMPNDIRLAENSTHIDLILGGHDHNYDVRKVNDRYIIKSGTDFRQMSRVTVSFCGSTADVRCEKIDITAAAYNEDELTQTQLERFSGVMEGKMSELLGEFAVSLDGRFEAVRRGETNLGNWVCDIILAATGADLVILNSGTLRADKILPPGPFTLGDLVNIVPMRDPLVVLQVSGADILLALENGVSAYPRLEGRFPQVAGVSFGFDPTAPPGQRVDASLVRVGDEYLDPNQKYLLATKAYLHSGCDGYTGFKQATVVLDEEEAPELGLAIQNHFEAIKVRMGKSRRMSRHRQSLVTLSRRHSLVKMLDHTELDGPPPLRRSLTSSDRDSGSPSHPLTHTHSHAQPRLTRRASLDDLENDTCALSPRVEGRIVLLTDQVRKEMLLERQRREADSVIPEVEESDSGSPTTPYRPGELHSSS
ncbi:trifunctional nucleotide phosphoesterase protein YfkN isoform X3 [Nilaparvata lugens]|uniref:trifunctional nucleotide phosphoesterase protein YfkN isoform X3 n=2 Tax=Nilaparvata lugens TaxID=108931 RepID=UPI00193E47C3|nr:trifunctional nucleotide phosphoesterase protein YfkN isoform X3 [Nilaparvata lugens]XP_039298684.1 trifunctional nucleotide phosphoesterase protein YfkN isoform X3 [Nilaparvata lugens]